MRFPLLRAILILACLSCFTHAESDAGGDAFVNAYVTAQQGEKAEQAGNYKQALSKFRQAAKELEMIATKYPSWSPTIVKYRKDRTAEAIVRIQDRLVHLGAGGGSQLVETPGESGGTMPSPDSQAPLPDGNPIFPSLGPGDVEPSPPAAVEPRNLHSNTHNRKNSPPKEDEDVSGELGKVDRRLKDLESQLSNARREISVLETDKAGVLKKLEEASSARDDARRKQQILEKRADNAETALRDATNNNSASAEKLAVLQKELTDSKKALSNSKIEADGDAEYRRELDERYKAQLSRISTLIKEREEAKSMSSNAPGRIEAIQKQLDATKKEKDALALKLQRTESQLTEVSKERDEALAQVTKLKEAQKQVDKLVADNADLMAKLAEAQKSVASFKASGLEKDQEIASLKGEVASVKRQLDDTRKQSAAYQKEMGDLRDKLDQTAKELAGAKSENAANAAERAKMQEENKILRGIVLREQRQEADRQAMKKVVLGELAKLEINSKTLLKQIGFLSEPTVKLSAKERGLFKKPELQVSETEISLAVGEPASSSTPAATEGAPSQEPPPALPKPVSEALPASPTPAPLGKASPAPAPVPPPAAKQAAKQAPPLPAKGNEPEHQLLSMNSQSPSLGLTPASNKSNSAPLFDTSSSEAARRASQAPPPPAQLPANTPKEEAAPLSRPDTAPDTARTPPVPEEFIPLAKQAKEMFERGDFLNSEKAYRRILAKYPRNLYTLSNLAVVLFRAGKNKLAEEMFLKAIAVAPEDGFSHCTLGIVYYQESRLDDAVNELTKALAINPNNPTAHNYLGIAASQKGWQEAAQKELEGAINLDPNYADAYFNLAVVFATQQPANKEEAKKNYKRAIELGAEPDAALEQLIK